MGKANSMEGVNPVGKDNSMGVSKVSKKYHGGGTIGHTAVFTQKSEKNLEFKTPP